MHLSSSFKIFRNTEVLVYYGVDCRHGLALVPFDIFALRARPETRKLWSWHVAEGAYYLV